MNLRWLPSWSFRCVWLSHPSLGTPTDHSSPHLLALALVQRRCRSEVVWRSSSHSEWLLRSWWWWIQSWKSMHYFLRQNFIFSFHINSLPFVRSGLSPFHFTSHISALQLSSLWNQPFATIPPFALDSPAVPVETAVFLLPTAATVAEHDLTHTPHSPHSVLKTVGR